MKKLSEVPFDKIYIGMPIVVISKNSKSQGEITGLGKDKFGEGIVGFRYRNRGQRVLKMNELKLKVFDGICLDPTRM